MFSGTSIEERAIYRHSFFVRTTIDWNHLEDDAPSTEAFRERLANIQPDYPDSQPPLAPQLASKSSVIGPQGATRGGPLKACPSSHCGPPTVGPLMAQAVGPVQAALSGPSTGQ